MEFYDLGTIIKELRILKNISQSELCRGICSQSQISKIEKGTIYPSSILLIQIAEKLGIDPNYIFALTKNKKLKYIENVKYVMRDCVKQKKYKELYEIVKIEKNKTNFLQKDDKQFLLWHEALAIFYVNGSTKNAVDILNKALKLTSINSKFLSEKEINIVHSIAVIHAENKEYEKSINILKKILNNFNKIDFPKNKEIQLKIIYNLTKCLHNICEHEEAIKYSDMGIKLAININSLYLLGELYFEKGSNLLKLEHPQKDGLNDIKKALFIFELTERKQYIKIIKDKYFKKQN
ncbi:helix-turn-helix domain-containing protein [Bacillus pseudomycoides]|uniref:helix-turn-helix domain-containing protein n=1 Tax=Bacillus pseudomycoides TaxID=64104 RepID=UPI000BF1340B|nr:helix-turn-helix domain-containing protein [Bacillus pseudomycoides]PEI37425.1 DNA-binding protein [Bacillus pseudomycoides]PGA75783.1 DNA-binding protein [Bacillus pseudomycoides]PHE13825.1 DNA-binding protein [Bacillus pseudomycoides]PHE84044.1 DNA-binding protein [Bacillus pseudomycoides]